MKSTVDHIICFLPSSTRVTFYTFLFSILLIVSAGVSISEENPSNTPAASKTAATLTSQAEFEYQTGNRKDPFMPFITEKASSKDVKMDEIVEVEGKLTGMQLFEPGQLTLVALMKGSDGDYAMVQDSTGKGYVISEGTLIGKRGVVKEISPNRIVIEETAQTRAGQKIVTNIEMVLKKEGEE